jgi:quinoprotein glucose dehydrogenase
LGGPIVTAGGLVFIGATMDASMRAFSVHNGAELWRAKLPTGARATPMTFQTAAGKQYVVIAAGGHDNPFSPVGDAIVAFRLP